jgi:hypothetical protein
MNALRPSVPENSTCAEQHCTRRMRVASDPSTCCTECQQSFATRNELFAHLRSAACGGDADGISGVRKAPFEYVALAVGYLGDHFQVPPLSLRSAIAREEAMLRAAGMGPGGVCAVCAQGLQACAGLDNTLEAVLSRVLFDDSRSHTPGAPPPPMASERLFTRSVQTGAHVHALVNVLGTCLPKLTAEHPPPTEEQSAAATSGAPLYEP